MLGLSDTGKAAADEFVAAAPDIIVKLQAAGMTVEAGLISGVHSALSDGISQAGSVVQADLAPVVTQLTAFNKNIADVVALVTRLLDEGVQIGGRPPKP